MKKPSTKIWYHGTKEKLEEPIRPLYLSSSKSVATLYGKVYAFTIDPGAKWLDLDKVEFYTPSMDGIGYSETWPEKLRSKGWDVVWDSEDYLRGHAQIFILNPKVLQLVESDLVEAITSLVGTTLGEVLK